MMNKWPLLLTVLTMQLTTSLAFAQTVVASGQAPTVESNLHFDTPDAIFKVAIDFEVLAPWVQPLFKKVDQYLGQLGTPRYCIIQLTMYPDRDMVVVIASQPPLEEKDKAAILTMTENPTISRSKYAEATISYHTKVAGASDAPSMPKRIDFMAQKFQKADTAARVEILRSWAKTEVLPVLGTIASNVDAQFVGVREMGKVFSEAALKADGGRIDPVVLADGNSVYWRSIMEMGGGEPMTAVGRIFLDVVNGDLDRARSGGNRLWRFTKRDNATHFYLYKLMLQLQLFYNDLDKSVQQGIARYDSGDYEAARKTFEAILVEYPNSSYIHHELALTLSSLGKEAELAKVQERVFRCDPMYSQRINSNTGLQLYRTFRRMELDELFKDRKKLKEDLMRYVGIALDLEQPAIASTMLWHSLPFLGKDVFTENIELFLYGLEKLGVTDIKNNFKNDHQAAFSAIEARRKKELEESPMYQSMEVKE